MCPKMTSGARIRRYHERGKEPPSRHPTSGRFHARVVPAAVVHCETFASLFGFFYHLAGQCVIFCHPFGGTNGNELIYIAIPLGDGC